MWFLFAVDLHCMCITSSKRDISVGTHFISSHSEVIIWSLHSLLLAMQPCSSEDPNKELRLQRCSGLSPLCRHENWDLRKSNGLPQISGLESGKPQKTQWERDHDIRVISRELQGTERSGVGVAGRAGCVLALLSIMACNNKMVLARNS